MSETGGKVWDIDGCQFVSAYREDLSSVFKLAHCPLDAYHRLRAAKPRAVNDNAVGGIFGHRVTPILLSYIA